MDLNLKIYLIEAMQTFQTVCVPDDLNILLIGV